MYGTVYMSSKLSGMTLYRTLYMNCQIILGAVLPLFLVLNSQFPKQTEKVISNHQDVSTNEECAKLSLKQVLPSFYHLVLISKVFIGLCKVHFFKLLVCFDFICNCSPCYLSQREIAKNHKQLLLFFLCSLKWNYALDMCLKDGTKDLSIFHPLTNISPILTSTMEQTTRQGKNAVHLHGMNWMALLYFHLHDMNC